MKQKIFISTLLNPSLNLSKKLGLIALFCLFDSLYAMDFESFYRQVHKQSIEKNPILFRKRVLFTRESYHALKKEKEIRAADGALVLVFSKIKKFIYFNEMSGVGIATRIGSNLQFDIKYFETLQDIGIDGEIKAMCVLPRFDKCILLGYEAF